MKYMNSQIRRAGWILTGLALLLAAGCSCFHSHGLPNSDHYVGWVTRGRVFVSVVHDTGSLPSPVVPEQSWEISTKKVTKLPAGLPIRVTVTDIIDHPEASTWKPCKQVVVPGEIRLFIEWFSYPHTMDYRPGPISAQMTLQNLRKGDYDVFLDGGERIGTIQITGREIEDSSNKTPEMAGVSP